MGNELKISLENFQSISEGELTFDKGLNFIIGQSNSGKSATFRALKACLTNPKGSQRFIKRDTGKASVKLTYNGNEILWERTPKESKYTINGEQYCKTGHSNAFNLVDDLGFVKDANDVIMNIEEELQLPFPFGIAGSDLFKLYENVFCVSDSATILKSAKDHEEKVKGNLNFKEAELIKNEKKLEELRKFKEEVNLPQLVEYKKTLTEKSERLISLKRDCVVIKRALEAEKVEIPEVQSFTDKIKKYEELLRTKELIKRLKEFHKLDKALKVISYKERINLTDYTNMLKIREELRRVINLQRISLPIPRDFMNKLEEYNSLKSYIDSLDVIKFKISSYKTRIREINPRIEEYERDMKKFNVCPLCHRAL